MSLEETSTSTANTANLHTINTVMECERGFGVHIKGRVQSLTSNVSTSSNTQGHLATWPLLIKENVLKYLPNMQETSLGRERKNSRSTKPNHASPENTKAKEEGLSTEHIYASIFDLSTTRGKIETYLMGRFPTTSSRRSNFVSIPYEYDNNAVLAELIKSHNQHDIIRENKKLHAYPTQRGLKPSLICLNIDASMQNHRQNEQHRCTVAAFPSSEPWHNSAEQATRTWQNNIIAGLASTDPNPIYLSDRLIPQATTTLNAQGPTQDPLQKHNSMDNLTTTKPELYHQEHALSY